MNRVAVRGPAGPQGRHRSGRFEASATAATAASLKTAGSRKWPVAAAALSVGPPSFALWTLECPTGSPKAGPWRSTSKRRL